MWALAGEVEKFPRILMQAREILERFMDALSCIGFLERWQDFYYFFLQGLIGSPCKLKKTPSSDSTSTPHLAHSPSNIRAHRGFDRFHVVYGGLGPGPAFEKIENGVRDESAAGREDVTMAVAMLLASKKAKRLDQMKVTLCPGHGDAENTAFFFDLFGAARCHVGGYATVCDIKNEDRVPFLSLSGMDGRQNEVIFVEERCPGFGTGGLRRVKRDLCEKTLACCIPGGDLLQLFQIADSDH